MAVATVAMAVFAYQQSQIIPEIQSQARDLSEQTRYITRPANLSLILDFYKERDGIEPSEIRNPINLTILNTGAQPGIVSKVVVDWVEVDRTPSMLRSYDVVPFPTKIIPPSGSVMHAIKLHPPLIITESGPNRVQYTVKIFNESPSKPAVESDWFLIDWRMVRNEPMGECAGGGSGVTNLCARSPPLNRE
jgi:hypothetical protein